MKKFEQVRSDLDFIVKIFDDINSIPLPDNVWLHGIRNNINAYVESKGYEIMYNQGEIGLYKDGVKQ